MKMVMSCAKLFILLSLACYVTGKKSGYKYQAAEQQERAPAYGYDSQQQQQNSEQDYDPGYTNQPSPDYVEQNAEFYAFEAPQDVHEDAAHLEEQFASALQKNLRVVFIRAPENKAIDGAFHALAKHTSEDKTAIYVLHKQNDASELAIKLSSLKAQQKSKPEVHFVKYKTPEEAVNAQRYIQEQYNQALPGASQSYNGGTAPVLNFASNYGGQTEQRPEVNGYENENSYEVQEPAAQLNGGLGPVENFAANYGGQQEFRNENAARGESEQGYGLPKPAAHLPGTGNGALYAGVGDPSAYSGAPGDDDNDNDNDNESGNQLPIDQNQYYPGTTIPSAFVDSYGIKHASNGLSTKAALQDAPAPANSAPQNVGNGYFGGAGTPSPYRGNIPLANGAYYAGAGIQSAFRSSVNKVTKTVTRGYAQGPNYDEGREADETDGGDFDASQAYGISPRTKGTPSQALRLKDSFKQKQGYGKSGRTKGSAKALRFKDDYNPLQAGGSALNKAFTQTDRVDFKINERQRNGPKMVFPTSKPIKSEYSYLQRYKRKNKKH